MLGSISTALLSRGSPPLCLSACIILALSVHLLCGQNMGALLSEQPRHHTDIQTNIQFFSFILASRFLLKAHASEQGFFLNEIEKNKLYVAVGGGGGGVGGAPTIRVSFNVPPRTLNHSFTWLSWLLSTSTDQYNL